MENNFDTIVAIATPMAKSAIGIIRISGSRAYDIAKEIFKGKIENHKICFGYIVDNGKKLDEVILLPFESPKSYTGEDVIEIQSHGSYTILSNILELILSKGARMASRGEFTKRAFLNQRIDLSQAEAVLDLINSRSTKSVDTALNNLEGYLKSKIISLKNNLTNLYSRLIASVDFPEDVAEVDTNYIVTICNDNIQEINKILAASKSHDYLRDGINVALIGRPNVGKSSLFNALLNYNRSIVTEIEGTTRDTIKENINIDGYLVNFTDTAGIRNKENADKVEKIGIDNSIEAIKQSEIIVFLFENNKTEIDDNLLELAKGKKVIFAKTKFDINSEIFENAINISALTGYGIDEFKSKILTSIRELVPDDTDFTTNKRHQACLLKSKKALENVINTATSNHLADLCASDLKEAILSLDEITGEVLTDNILENIFDNFCIGK